MAPRGIIMKVILLVEDSKFLRLANERILAKAGYGVVTASDGEEALRAITNSVPDLILLDMLLPRLGGPELLRALRKNPDVADVPIIVLSSLSQANEVKLKAEGASAYIEKSKLILHEKADFIVQVVQQFLPLISEHEPDSVSPDA